LLGPRRRKPMGEGDGGRAMIRCIGKAGARHPSWIHCPIVQISKAGWTSISLPNDATERKMRSKEYATDALLCA